MAEVGNMTTVVDDSLRERLLERRDKLHVTASMLGANAEFERLLGEVDAALARMDNGSYGLCEACHDPWQSNTRAKEESSKRKIR